ncbi:unnamed protein product [Phyllotreta striolata]|uniref:Chitin-binding type-2 domain-containing protein n=1 Tax=Phyllotreta striolata TaxID=444603 RepID=A0A9N9TJS5_PHYSR|nr:unnamed protein product [Phyllotreta striolata]
MFSPLFKFPKSSFWISVYFFQMITTTFSQPNCPQRDSMFPVYIPHEDCSKFWQCSNGIPYLFNCSGILHFNPTLNVCDWPQFAGCKSKTDPSSSTTSSSSKPPISTITSSSSSESTTTESSSSSVISSSTIPSTTTVITSTNPSTISSSTSTASSTSSSITTSTVTSSSTTSTDTPETTVTEISDTSTSTTDSPESSSSAFSSSTSASTERTSTVITTSETSTNSEVDTSTLTEMTTSIETENSTESSSTPTEFVSTTTDTYTEVTTEETTDSSSIETATTTETSPDSISTSSIFTSTSSTTTEASDIDDMIYICENVPNDYFLTPHPYNCSLYIACNFGRAIIMNCPAGLEFNTQKQRCLQPEDSDCRTQVRSFNKTEAENSDYICRIYEIAFLAHPMDCSKFVVCIYGRGRVLQCPDQKWYDAPRRQCVHPLDTTCKISRSISILK